MIRELPVCPHVSRLSPPVKYRSGMLPPCTSVKEKKHLCPTRPSLSDTVQPVIDRVKGVLVDDAGTLANEADGFLSAVQSLP